MAKMLRHALRPLLRRVLRPLPQPTLQSKSRPTVSQRSTHLRNLRYKLQQKLQHTLRTVIGPAIRRTTQTIAHQIAHHTAQTAAHCNHSLRLRARQYIQHCLHHYAPPSPKTIARWCSASVIIAWAALASLAPPAPYATDSNAIDFTSAEYSLQALIESDAIEIKPFDYLETAETPLMPPRPYPRPRIIFATIRRNDSLSTIFARNHLNIQDAIAIAALKPAASLAKIHPGDHLHIAATDEGDVLSLRHELDAFNTLYVDKPQSHRPIIRSGDQRFDQSVVQQVDQSNDAQPDNPPAFIAELVTRTPDIKLQSARADIDRTLLDAAAGADIAAQMIYNFAEIFAWQVDFNRELRRGDEFALIYEQLYLDGKHIADGAIIAAELVLSGKRLRAVRHIDNRGRAVYYTPDGRGLRSSFLRSPLKFARVTSKFSKRRLHPILKKWRAHKGVDYGAPTGTPVRVTGDGVVIDARARTGYGNTITIRHGAKYTTLYAHLHKFARGIRNGTRVKQGDVIGYVGSTGWSTGPHLHYEFRIDGVHRNPLTVKLPRSASIASADKARFIESAQRWIARLQQIDYPAIAQASNAAAAQ